MNQSLSLSSTEDRAYEQLKSIMRPQYNSKEADLDPPAMSQTMNVHQSHRKLVSTGISSYNAVNTPTIDGTYQRDNSKKVRFKRV